MDKAAKDLLPSALIRVEIFSGGRRPAKIIGRGQERMTTDKAAKDLLPSALIRVKNALATA